MRTSFYVQLNQQIRADRNKRRWVLLLNDILAYPVMLFYLVGLIMFCARKDFRDLFLLVFVPFVGFCLARVLRYLMKEPRPYRVSKQIRPLVRKRKTSYSFPSCHCASAFVIANCLCVLGLKVFGVVCFLLAIAIAILRVLSGAHYIRDVIAGSALGLIIGFVPLIIH